MKNKETFINILKQSKGDERLVRPRAVQFVSKKDYNRKRDKQALRKEVWK